MEPNDRRQARPVKLGHRELNVIEPRPFHAESVVGLSIGAVYLPAPSLTTGAPPLAWPRRASFETPTVLSARWWLPHGAMR
jgi:hypothetical protein